MKKQTSRGSDPREKKSRHEKTWRLLAADTKVSQEGKEQTKHQLANRPPDASAKADFCAKSPCQTYYASKNNGNKNRH